MIQPNVVALIKQDLLLTQDPIIVIAQRYNISKASVNNINTGKSHKENMLYPIRQPANYSFTENEVGFIRKLNKRGYSAKQIHIIMGKGSYSTISNIITEKTRPGIYDYNIDEDLEHRLRTFNFIITPHSELINTYTDTLTLEDAVYIKLLGRFMAPLIETVEVFMPLIESDMLGYNHKIITRDDLAAYLEWGGVAFNTIWLIKNIYNNKFTFLKDEKINFESFDVNRFLDVDESIDLILIKEMINFETKENFRRAT
jgi:hypothetical protein